MQSLWNLVGPRKKINIDEGDKNLLNAEEEKKDYEKVDERELERAKEDEKKLIEEHQFTISKTLILTKISSLQMAIDQMAILLKEKKMQNELETFKSFNYSLQSFIQQCNKTEKHVFSDSEVMDALINLLELPTVIERSTTKYKELISSSLSAAFEQCKIVQPTERDAQPSRRFGMK